MNDLVRK